MDSSSPMAGKYSLRTRWPGASARPDPSLRRRDEYIRRSVGARPCTATRRIHPHPKTSPAAMPDSGCASMVGTVPLHSTTWRHEAQRARRHRPDTKSSCQSVGRVQHQLRRTAPWHRHGLVRFAHDRGSRDRTASRCCHSPLHFKVRRVSPRIREVLTDAELA